MSDDGPTKYKYVVTLARIFASPSTPPGDQELSGLGDTDFVYVEARHAFEAICLAYPACDWPCEDPDIDTMEDQNDLNEAEQNFDFYEMLIFQHGFKLNASRIPEDGEFIVRESD